VSKTEAVAGQKNGGTAFLRPKKEEKGREEATEKGEKMPLL